MSVRTRILRLGLPGDRATRALAASLTTALLACNALFDIEEKRLATDLDDGAAESPPSDGNGATGPDAPRPSENGDGQVTGPDPTPPGGGSSSQEMSPIPVVVEPPATSMGTDPTPVETVPTPPPDPSDPFVIESGGIRQAGLGINTWLYLYVPPLGTRVEGCPVDGPATAEAPCLSNASGALCMRGQVDAIRFDAQGNYLDGQWGPQLGFGFAQEDPWDRAGGRVAGLSFRVDGANVPATLRVSAGPPGDDYPEYCQYLEFGADAEGQVRFDDLLLSCWGEDPDQALPPALGLASVFWKIEPVEDVDQPFDFCIRDITPILAE